MVNKVTITAMASIATRVTAGTDINKVTSAYYQV
jgi:hypothetical protein